MTITERFRQITEQIEHQADLYYTMLPEESTTILRFVDRAVEELQDVGESVGEIPQFQLDAKLSPVLLKAHEQLDRARVQLEKDGHEDVSGMIWELEQLIYRLLNDL